MSEALAGRDFKTLTKTHIFCPRMISVDVDSRWLQNSKTYHASTFYVVIPAKRVDYSRPDHVKHRPSSGRYNAGVRALRSPVKPQAFIQAYDKQSHPSGGRFNAGVRAPQSQHGHTWRHRTLEPNDLMFSQFKEGRSAPGCSRPVWKTEES